MDAVEKLLAIEEIKGLKARYFRLMDTKKWDEWEQLFAPDLVAEFPDDQPDAAPMRGRSDFAKAIAALNGPALTIHHGHTPEIEVLSPTTARGIWVMLDFCKYPKPGSLPGDATTLVGYGHYHEAYEKLSRGWVIKTLKLTRLKLDYS